MLSVSKKDQYAIRAIYELAKHMGQGPRKISDIASAQGIPPRFLEVILGQLKGSGFVASKRGFYGGYYLVRPPGEISVGDILRFMQRRGGRRPADCAICVSSQDCPNRGNCAFSEMWNQVNLAVFRVYDQTNIQNLIEDDRRRQGPSTNPDRDNRSQTTRM